MSEDGRLSIRRRCVPYRQRLTPGCTAAGRLTTSWGAAGGAIVASRGFEFQRAAVNALRIRVLASRRDALEEPGAAMHLYELLSRKPSPLVQPIDVLRDHGDF